jgi:hypothetical protein
MTSPFARLIEGLGDAGLLLVIVVLTPIAIALIGAPIAGLIWLAISVAQRL